MSAFLAASSPHPPKAEMPGQPSPQPVGTEPMNRTASRTHQASAVTAQPRRRASVSRETARSVVNVEVSVIGEALASDETVAIAGFGTFSARSRPARRGRNPRTGERIAIAASTSPAFKAGKTLRDQLNAKT